MLASLLALASHTAAQADPIPTTNWAPVAISDIPGASTVTTDATGGVTVGCQQSASSTLFKSFSATGAIVQNQPIASGTSGSFCTGPSTVGKDGTVYVGISSGNSQYVQAWKNNRMVWRYAIPCGPYGTPWTMVMGANGNMYMVVTQGSGTCYSTQLIGLTPTAKSGTTAPQVVMNQHVYGGSVYGQGLAAYNNGLVMYMNGSIQYVSYSGTFGNPIALSNTLTSQIGMVDRWFEATTSGRVFVVNRASTGQSIGCTDPNNDVGSITAIDPGGSTWTTPLLSACTYLHEIHPTPTGGFVMRSTYVPSTIGGQPVETIIAFDQKGQSIWSKTFTGFGPLSSMVVSVDLNGDIAVRSNLVTYKTINGSTYKFPEIDFSLLSGVTGKPIDGAQLALRGDTSTVNGPSYMWGNGGESAMAKNTVYAAYQCTTLDSCDMSTTTLYAFTVPGVTMDYSQGVIFGIGGQPQNYVAMGDSFSAGQGVPPFVSPSDTDGCHRSSQAYPFLLTGSAAHPLTLQSFAACSGAQTSNVVGGQNGEPAQINALNSSTRVVTISIGGNDIGFSQFVTQCLFLDCSNSAANQPFFDKVSNVGSALSSTYGTILAGAPNATVYVVGYPQLLPDPSLCPNPFDAGVAVLNSEVQLAHTGDTAATTTVYAIGRTAGLSDPQIQALINTGQVTFTAAEITTARNMTAALDSKISATVSAVGNPRLRYVDATATRSPFASHELCTGDPYFNGVDIGRPEYSFHPNLEGQDAYRRLLLSNF
jgi:lysophospholipase L1-like esterase